MAFAKATKYQSKLRCAIFGPSGAGKTLTSLLIAHGMGNKIALIDSENGTASKYAGRVVDDGKNKIKLDFDTEILQVKTVQDYINKMREAEQGGYDVLIVDSSSHAWKELIEEVDRIAKAKYKGNTWSAWSEGNPLQNEFVEELQNHPAHEIFTMRSKTEWVTEKTQDGKSKPVRVGLSPEQGKGIEYEFDILIEMDEDNNGRVIKDRTGKFQGKIIPKPGIEFGRQLLDWLSEGDAPPLPEHVAPIVSKNSEMVAKIQQCGEEVLSLLREEFGREVLGAYTFGQKFGWDEEMMFAELKLRKKQRDDADNRKAPGIEELEKSMDKKKKEAKKDAESK